MNLDPPNQLELRVLKACSSEGTRLITDAIDCAQVCHMTEDEARRSISALARRGHITKRPAVGRETPAFWVPTSDGQTFLL